MEENAQCPRCGAKLTGQAIGQLCANCLLGLAQEPAPEATLPIDEFPSDSAAPARVRYLGDYELLEEIARGGMGVVYKARQVTLNRIVAIKMILAGDSSSAAIVERFQTEAEAAARLEHPGIVPIYEIGTHEGQHYFSMRFLDGGSLAQRIQRGSRSQKAPSPTGDRTSDIANRPELPHVGCYPPKEAAALMMKVARAVHHAHQRGILHRDLKPGNILFDQAGEPHVADFGLAKVLEHDSSLTVSGAVMGTPSYMAPEQAAGQTKQLSTAADVYSLGAILYELLTGRPPFSGPTPAETMRQVVEHEPERPSLLNAMVDRDLETVCLRCLEKDPARRHGSAEALAEELGRFLRNEPIHSRPVSRPERLWRWCRRKPALAASVVLLHFVLVAGLTGILWQWQRAERNARDARASAAENRKRAVTLNVASGSRLMEQGDYFGALLWFVKALQLDTRDAATERNPRVRIASVLRHSHRLLQLRANQGPEVKAALSPDGGLIAVTGAEGAVQLWDTEGGDQAGGRSLDENPSSSGATVKARARDLIFHPSKPQLLVIAADRATLWDLQAARVLHHFAHPRLYRAAFSRDGNQLATGSWDGSIKVWDVASGQTKSTAPKHRSVVECVVFSPDGQRLASSGDDQTAVIWDLASGQKLVSITNAGRVLCVSFNPDGTRIATGDSAFVARVWDARTGQPLSLPMVHEENVFSVRFSPDGKFVATASEDFTAKIWDAKTGAQLSRPLQHANAVLDAVFNSDGRLLITRGFDGLAQVWEVPAGRPYGPPLWHGGLVSSAAFHPDGERVVTASADGCVRLWELSGGPQPYLPWSDPLRRVVSAAWEGARIIVQESTGEVRVWDTATWQPVSEGTPQSNRVDRAWLSRDGDRLITEADGTGGPNAKQYDLWEVPSGRHLHSVSHVAAWTRAQSRVRVNADCSTLALLWLDRVEVLDMETGRSLPIPRMDGKPFYWLAFSPDGQRLAVAGGKHVWNWFTATGSEVFPPLDNVTPVFKVEFSPDGLSLVTAGSDALMAARFVQTWDAHTGQPVGLPLRHADGVSAVEFSPDGRKLATGCEEESARVWDAKAGQPLTPRLRNRGAVDHVKFSSDGQWIVSSGTGPAAAARVWDAASGEPLMPPVAHGKPNGQAFLLANGRYLLTIANLSKRLWDLSPDNRPVEDLIALAELLSGHRLDATEVFQPLPEQTLAEAWMKLKSKYPQQFAFGERTDLGRRPLTQEQLRHRFNARPFAASIALGSQNQEDGLELRQNSDGRTAPATMSGSECQQLTVGTNTERFVYFAIHPMRKSAETSDYILAVEYFDAASGRLAIDYDGEGSEKPRPYTQTARVQFTGRLEWKTAYFHLPRARFKNSQNVGADFRLSVRANSFFVRRVALTELPPPRSSRKD